MKRALVTGGSGGIGAAICRKLAANQFHVYVHANQSLSKAEEVVREINAAGGVLVSAAADVEGYKASTDPLKVKVLVQLGRALYVAAPCRRFQ